MMQAEIAKCVMDNPANHAGRQSEGWKSKGQPCCHIPADPSGDDLRGGRGPLHREPMPAGGKRQG